MFQTKNRQHLVCIQWVDQEFEVHKELVRLHAINFNDASHVCLCFNQSCNQSAISKIRGQCYDIDGATAMAGARFGVTELASEDNSLYIVWPSIKLSICKNYKES